MAYSLGLASFWCFVIGAQRLLVLSVDPADRAVAPSWIILLVSGILLGLSNLTKPLNLLNVMALPAALAFLLRQRVQGALFWRRSLLAAIAMAVGVALVVAPWIFRQQVVHGIWTFSENTAEVLFAATSPEYGCWSNAVSALGPTAPIKARVDFYNERLRRNLRDHPRFFLSSLVRHTRRTMSDVVGHEFWLGPGTRLETGWFLTALLVVGSWLVLSGAASCGRRFWITFGVLLLAPAVASGGTFRVFWIVGALMALRRADPIVLVAASLPLPILTLGAMALTRYPRMYHPLEWAAFTMTAWCLWQILGRARDDRWPETNWLDEESFARRSWGPVALPFKIGAGVFFAIFLLGLGLGTAANVRPHQGDEVKRAVLGPHEQLSGMVHFCITDRD